MWRGLREWLLGAADQEVRALDQAPGIEPERLQELRYTEPALMLSVEQLYVAAQRAFERRTREAVAEDLLRALAAVAGGAGTDRLDAAAGSADARLAADSAIAGARGLNTGVACGFMISPVVLLVVLILGRWAPRLFGATLGCPEQQALLHALVCFAGGAMGAVFSVIIRLRDSAHLSRRRPGHGDLLADPVQWSRTLRQEGWYRVVVGWFLATSLFLLINGGILSILTPPAASVDLCAPGPLSAAGHDALIKAWFYWGGIGFLAGLNERWAHGLLRQATTPRSQPGPRGDG